MEENYSQELYDWIVSQDDTFEEREPFEQWQNKVSEDAKYQDDLYQWISSVDNTFEEREPFAQWSQKVKKKDEPVSTSPEEVMGGNIQVMGEDGSLEPSVQEDEAEAAAPVEEVVAETPAVVEEVVAEEINPATAQFNFDEYTEESVEPTVTEGVMYDPKEEGMQFDTTITYPESSTTFERSLSYITPQLIRREEEEVVNRMDYLFGDDVDGGFKFEETGAGDAMIVTASNGETHYVDLDKFDQILNEDGEYINSLLESERPNIIKFQEFLRNNRKPFEGDEVSYKEDLENIKYFSRKAVDLDVATVKSESNALTQRFSNYKKTLSNVQFQIDDLSQQGSLNPEQLALYNSLLSQKKELSNEKNNITDKYENLIKSNAQIERNVGEYLSMKLDDGNAVSTLAKGFMNGLVTKGITAPVASLVGGVMDVFYGVAQSIDEDFGMTENEKKERYVTIAKDLGYDVPDNIEDDAVYNSWIEGLNNPEMEEGSGYSREINDLLIADGYDPTRTLVATGSGGGRMMWKKDGGLLGNGEYEEQPDYAFDKTKGERLKRLVLDAEVKESKNPTKEYVRHMLDFMAAEGVSDERVARNKGESIIQEGLYGLAESLPSIALYALARGKNKPAAEPVKGVLKRLGRSFKNYITNRGAVAQTLGFTLLQTDALMVEMENDPDFKYITETEKKALTLPLAITTAVLERWGLRSIVTNKTLVANLMKTVTSRLAVGASPSAFRTMMNKVVQHNISKGVYRVAGATVMEYETGGLQQVAEIGMKDVWNDMYEKEMFTTPDGEYLEWGSEYLQQVNRAALAEAVGGFVMGTPGAIATAFNKNQFDEISDSMIDLFDEIRNDKVTVEAYKARLDLKVIAKEMTKEEAQKALLDFEVLSSSAETVSGIQGLTKQQTKEALGLTYLKNQLEHLLSKTDPNVGNNYELIEAQLNDVTSKLKNIGTSRVITQEEEELVEDIKSEQDILDTQDLTQEDRTAREENLTKLKQELSAVQEAAPSQTETEQDAIQEPSTEKVDVQESSLDSGEMGEGDTTVQPSITGETQEEGESESDIAQAAEEEVSLDERAEQIDELIKKENEDSAPKDPQPIPEEQIEVVDETISINKPKAPPVRNNPLRESVIRRAKNVSKSLKKVFPNVKIILHETSEAFVDATGRLGRGEYIGNTIHVNLELADGTTVGHEAFHVIIVNKLLTDTAAQEVTKRMLKSLLKTLRNNDPLAIEIRNFMKGYDQKIQTEEGVAQMLGILSSRYKLLAPKQKTIIGKWIDIIKKLLGKEVDIITESDQQVVDLLNTLISKLTSGIEIESSDLSVIDKIKEDVDNTPAVEEEVEAEVETAPEEEVEKQVPVTQAQKNLFGETHTDENLKTPSNPKGQAKISNITSLDKEGVSTATYVNVWTGSVDVIISSKDKKNFVGYVRVYKNGKPTNMFSTKMESTGGAFKNMITSADTTLPDGAKVLPGKTISEGGLKSFNNSKLDVETDSDGNVVTRETDYSDATKETVKQKGDRAFGKFVTPVKSKAEAEIVKIQKAYPGIKAKIVKSGLSFAIKIDLPVLIKTETTQRQQKTVEGLREGKMTTTTPVKIYKGIGGKKDIRGQRINAHKGVKGIFSAVDKKLAEEYGREEGVAEIDLPSGVTIEVVEVATKGLDPKQYRAAEVKAINESDAQVVKLITIEGKVKGLLRNGDGKQQQYIIKDFDLVPELKAQKPTTRQQQEAKEVYESNPKLANIGTLQQYDEYLKSVFPNSEVKDFLYHGGNKNIQEFSKEQLGETTKADSSKLGFFFSNNKDVSLTYIERYRHEAIGELKVKVDEFNETYKKLKESVKNDYADSDVLYKKSQRLLTKVLDYIKKLLNDKFITSSELYKKQIKKTEDSAKKFENFVQTAKRPSLEISMISEKELYENYAVKSRLIKDKKLYTVLLDIRNPLVVNYREDRTDGGRFYVDSVSEAIKNNNDAAILEDVIDINTDTLTKNKDKFIGNDYVVFENNQIHILGSNKDVKGFEDFAKNNSEAAQSTQRQQQVNVFEGGEQQQGEGGEVGVIRLQQRQQQDFISAPKVDKDSRPWVKRVTNTIDVITLNGKNFITNMYDYTNAGRTDLGNGYEITLFGGRNYVPYIMDILGKKLGDVSHLAAFNTKAQAETFIRNSIEGDANYFAPHAGTLDGSWQFQQHIFEALTDMVLDKNIISNEELIKSFNRGLVRTPKALALALKEYKKNDKSFTKKGYYTQNKKKIYKAPVKPTKRIDAFKKFLKKYNEEQSKEDSKLTKLKNTENLNDFLNNPKKLVRLLNIENNFSPDLRKRLNQNIATNAKFKKAIGISKIDQFHQRIIDPLNKGVEGGEIMSFVKFDPSTFEIVKTDPNSPEHHPSFGWVVKAKIEQVSQPTKFYKSYEITDQYVKHNKNETIVSKKEDVTDAEFKSSNVSSSAGAIPKVAQVSIKESTTQRQQRTERLAPNGKRSNLTDVQYDTVRTKAFKNWFGDWENDPANASKVVDENGEPMVMYHGTPDGEFDVFREESYFTASKEYAENYQETYASTAPSSMKEKTSPKVFEVFLNFRNPFDTRIEKNKNIFNKEYYRQWGMGTPLMEESGLPDWNDGRDLLEWIDETDQKFDGIMLDEGASPDMVAEGKTRGPSYVPVEPNQIKLADGSNKTFDPDAPSIRQQIVDDTKSADNETKLRRFQDIVDKFSSATDIVNISRMAGFEDTEIKYYLQKKWRGEIDSKGNYKKLTVKEINKLLKAEELETVPASFGNVPGGMIKGLKLYQDTLAHFKKLIAQNEKKSKNKQISIQDIIHKSIEFMSTQTSYIDSSEGSKAKKQLSTLQQQLQSEMYEALGGKKIKEITKIISNLNKIIYQKRIGAREIRDVKRELQRVIREVMPKGVYTSSEVRSLLRQIQEAEPKWLKGNLKNIIQNIEEMAAEKNVSTLTKSIDEILNGKYVVTINNQAVGVKISQEYAEVLEAIKDKMYKGAEISDDIISEQTYIMTKIEELDNKMSLSPEEEMEYLVLNIALGINNAKLMDNNNPLKADQLLSVFENLKSLVTQGRNNFKADAKARSERYAKLTAKFYQALTNGEDVLDFTDEAVREKVKKAVKDARTLKNSNYGKEGTINKLKSYFQTIADNMVMVLSASTLDMSQLSQQLDMLPGEMFEGYIRDFMYRKVNESSRSYQESYMALQDLMTDKSIEYLGKKYTSKIKEYRKSLDFSEIENGKFFKDPKAVKEAQDEYNKNKTIKNRNTLNKVIALNIPFGDLTPMKLQYIYFQYKQPDTHAGFETSLGSNYKVIMDGLSKHFENNYKDLLNFGNWQVDVLLPLLHSKYNKVYKKIYHTNMPQRLNYSGRTFRLITGGGKVEMQQQDPLSLLGGKGTSQMSLNVIGNSTKLTKPNKEAIMAVDALTAIDTYLKDMEHFNAYAVNMNDITKVFFNKDIADTIINIHGKLVYNAIKNSLMASAMRGSNQSDEIIRMTNSANSVFIVNKVGAALTVYIKQLTSIATYGNFIGYRNWTKTAATMGPKEFMKAIKEISEESVYMKWRSFEQITKTIESYGETSMDKYTPGDKGGIIMRIITSPIKAGDKQAIYLGGIPNYVFLKKKYEAAGLSPEAAKQKALLMFEEHTKVVQQSSDKQDKDWLQNMGGAVQFFNMLLSSPKAYFRQIFSGYRELGRKVKAKDLNAGKGSAWQNIRTILVYQFGMPLLFQWATIGFPITDWDDEDKSDMKRAGLLSVFNSIFVVGQILEMIADYAQGKPWWKETKQLPIFDLVTDFIKQWDKTNNKDPEKAAEATKQAYFALLPLLALLKVPTSVASLPLKRLDNWQKNMDKIINGSATDPKEIMLRILNYSQSIAEQGKEEKPSKPLKLTKKELKEHLPELYEELEDVRMEMESDPDYIDYMEEKKLYDDAVKQEREQALEEIFAK